ncbi:mRNA-binding ribosome synthesis protein nop7 [Tulasnella sp. JGI-2019a]|nr:mRNA-binding ribosome synthesis protein nop7 [Tulasnella sp. JGI-2019a]
MGKLIKKGKQGPSKNYITRKKAIRKLQLTLNDFRRLCILKGIVPREPPSRKKANHGNSKATSFYYIKDINFLAHEPVLQKLRQHKTFMKKLTKALGRSEWGRAKGLEENRPVYKLDHIVKERYPTFIDAVRDIDDALCLVFLGANLTSHEYIPKEGLEDCARLAAEWQLFIMHTKALRKVFLSIKGIYYQAEVAGQTITWVVPYQFTQKIPIDVDWRVMLTFLEFYKTLLGFVFYKLYTDAALVYPPPLDIKKDEAAGGVDAYSLESAPDPNNAAYDGVTTAKKVSNARGRIISGKDVNKAIKALGAEEEIEAGPTHDTAEPLATATAITAPDDAALPSTEEFIAQPSSSKTPIDPKESNLVTLHTLSHLPTSQSTAANLFAPYTIYISRESPRHILEFIIRSFGGKVGWPATAGSGSPFDEDDESITHVVIDRPLVVGGEGVVVVGTGAVSDAKRRRKYVQPQWVVDSINAGKVLVEEPYGRGKILPPHLSPFNAEGEGAYDPLAALPHLEETLEEQAAADEDEMESINEEDGSEEDGDDDDEEEMEEDEEEDVVVEPSSTAKASREAAPPPPTPAPSQKITAPKPSKVDKKATKIQIDAKHAADEDAIRKAELEAERLGVEPAEFDDAVKKATLKSKKAQRQEAAAVGGTGASEENMAKMLLNNKKRKLYSRMKTVQARKGSEKQLLEQKKIALVKKQRKDARA